MISFKLQIITFFALVAISVSAESKSIRNNIKPTRSLRGTQENHKLTCVLVLAETSLPNDQDEEDWECIDENGRFVDIDAHYDDRYKDSEVGALRSSQTIFHSDDVVFVSDSKAIVRDTPHLSQLPENHNRHLETTGPRSVLVVRIEANDAASTYTESQLATEIFGVGNEDSFNLSSGFDRCSYGQLKLEPTTLVQDGIYTMHLDQDIIGEKNTDVRNVALEQLRTEMDTSDLNNKFHHVAFCFPPGTISKHGQDDWQAFGIVNGYVTLFNDKWCTSTSTLMHEIGHNLGLRHGNEKGEYKDMSGMMGYSFLGAGKPQMCFNTAKNWELGWFQDRHATVNPLDENFWEGNLIGFSDYKNDAIPDDASVIIKIEGHGKDYFVGFNRKDGINKQNQEAGAENKVTVHSVGTSNNESELEAKLNIGGSFEIPFFGNSEHSVVIQVENIDMASNPAVARVSVNYVKCTSNADCDLGTSCTTNTCNLSTGHCIHSPNDHCTGFMETFFQTDNYPGETSWSIVDNCKDNKVVMSGTGYDARRTTYEDSANVPPSKYTLKVNDSYGDGLCCSQGQGSFIVKFNDEIVAVGGEFGRSSEHTWGSCEVDTEAPSQSPTAPPTQAPSSAPTTCEMNYEVSFKARQYTDALTSWQFVYDEETSLTAKASNGFYQSESSYAESGCLKSNCYQFDISGVESYSLKVNGIEVANGENIAETEISLFGTCRPM